MRANHLFKADDLDLILSYFIKTIGGLFVFLILCFPVSSFASNHLMLLPDSQKINLGPFMEILEDEKGTLTIHDVTSPKFSKAFIKNPSSSINLGSTQSVYWFKCTIETSEMKSSDQWVDEKLNSDDWILYLGKHLDYYDTIQIFWQETTSHTPEKINSWQTLELGMHHAVKTGKRDPLAVKVTVPQGRSEHFTLYLRIQTSFGLFIDPALYSPTAFHLFSKKLSLFYGFYYGIALSLIIYNLFHFYFLRDRVRLIFIVYTVTLCIYFFISNELSFSPIPAAVLPATLKTAQFLALLTFIQMLWFTITFLDLNTSHPKLHRFLKIVMLVPAGLLVSLPFFSYAAIGKIISDVGLLVIIAVIAAGSAALINGYRPARFFLFGWGFFLLGGIIYALNFKGIFPYPFIGNNAAQIGSGIEMLFLSVAIADRVKYLLDQMNLAQAKRQKQLNALSQQLAQAEEHERSRIAGILHDSIGQTLMATKWEIERLISEGKIPTDQKSKLLSFLNGSIEKTRTLTAELYPKELQVFGLKTSLESMADDFSARYGLKIKVNADQKTEIKNEQFNIILYRAVSELLFNIVKHAKAEQVEIELHVGDESVTVEVQDDGIGFDYRVDSESDIKGFGLFKIQETLHHFDGSLKISPSRIGGSQVTLSIPILQM